MIQTFMNIRTILTAAAAALGLAACATEPEEEESGSVGRVELVGRVASVPPGRDFVLIQSFGEWRVADGTILTTRGADERTGSLLVTGEKLGQFAAADIRSGEVAVGDAVMRLPEPAPPEPTEPVEPDWPSAEDPGSGATDEPVPDLDVDADGGEEVGNPG